MEIVLVIAGLAGLALLIVPRMLRGRSRRVRTEARGQWTGAAASSRRSRDTRAVSRTATPRPAAAAVGGGSAATLVESEPYDDWDDDLGWGGTESTVVEDPPASRDAPVNGAAPPAEIDDHLEWDEEEPAPANGLPHPPPPPVEEDGPPPTIAEAAPAAPAVLDDELDWIDEAAPAPRRAAAASVEPAGTSGRNPLILVALYAALGIGAIVLTVSLLTGALSSSEGGTTAPRTSATVTPEATPAPAAPPAVDPAEAARLQKAFEAQRAARLSEQADAAAAAQRRARAASRRAEARRARARRARARARARRGAGAPTRAAPAPAAPAPAPATPRSATPAPAPAPAPRAPSGGGGGGGGCEFCIG